ncbi:MAG: glycosyltransferase [Rhodobacteraceae bacterium]|nr:glycosyltransferase [Paracoccaceae bacterium]
MDVVYSNTSDSRETGSGRWHAVSQSWFYGWKFRKALDLFLADTATTHLLIVSADATYADWSSLAQRAAKILGKDPDMGVWSPDLDRSPWPTSKVALARPGVDGCVDVIQTDGVVWAISAHIATMLSSLSYEKNNLGWGIDWAAMRIARKAGLRICRDLTCAIQHPESRGYDPEQARLQMNAFLKQLPKADQDWIRQTRARLASSARGTADRPSPTGQEFVMQQPFQPSTQTPICETHCLDGSVFIGTNTPIDGWDVFVRSGNEEIAFERISDPVMSGKLDRLLPFDTEAVGIVEISLNGHGAWQVEAWETLRIAFPVEMADEEMIIPVTLPVSLGQAESARRFTARLAVHRGRGNVVLRVMSEDGHTLQTSEVPFGAGFKGGTSPDGYQWISLPVPDAPPNSIFQVEVSFLGAAEVSSSDPYVFFVADPRLESPRLVGLAHSRSYAHRVGPQDPEHWYCAHLPFSMLASARAPRLCAPFQPEQRLYPSNAVQVTLSRDFGHLLEINSSDEFHGFLWINGEAAFPVHLLPGQNVIRFPPRFMTGEQALLQLRDTAGMQIIWQDWTVLKRQLTSLDHLQRESRKPYAADLFPQTAYRYQALRAHCAMGSPAEIIVQLDTAIEALEAGHDALTLKPLRFTEVEKPDVSVVIPAHNKVKVTYAALCALLLAWNKASFEVIVVDDASTDETKSLEDLVEGITVLHNETPERFIKACNAGVAIARGTYVVLLNNDTEPTVGWLDALIDAFNRFDRVGLVGSRLLYPDGRQQDAGGIVWGNGDPWNYGRLENPWEPRFSYARQADYLSGAALMTTRTIWEHVGGLSSYLEPMYFEDTDFAFKIREAGFTTWYIPSSVVYHYEGLTSGTDTASGFKRFQEVNRPKFKRRWAKAFTGSPKPGTAPDLEKDRGIVGRILFVDYTTPTPDRDAGSYAALQEIRLVQSLGYKVTFLPENLAWMGSYAEELQKMGVEMIVAPFVRNLDEFLDARAGEFDAFYITRYHVMQNVAPRIRARNPDARIIMNNADLHYLRLLRRSITDKDPAQIDAARNVRDQEIAAMRSADLVLSYNTTEHAVIDAISEGSVKVMTCPWVLDLPDTVAPRNGRSGLSFLGSFQHHPNVEGLDWFLQEVMKPLTTTRPDLILSIYGSRMPERIKALESDTVLPIGYIEDAAEAYDKHLVFVAPLLSGAGIKGKVLNALARGTPCVLSPVAAEGTGLRDGEDCLIAERPQDWADAIAWLTDDAALWQRIAENARAYAARTYSFERGRDLMRSAFEAVELFGARE